MGYCMSKYDDVRLNLNPFHVELSAESFYLRYPDGGAGDLVSMEIADDHLRYLLDALAAVEAYRTGDGAEEPSDEQKESWKRAETDKRLVESAEADGWTALELRRAADLLEGKP